MGNTNTPYIAKNAAPLVNPITATVFQQTISPIATVAATQIARTAYAKYAGYAQYGAGTSNNINLINIAVRASGRMTFGAAGNFTPSLVLGPYTSPTLSTPPLPTAAFSTIGTLTPQAASGPGVGLWSLSANLAWDPNSGVIGGTLTGYEVVLVAGVAAEQLTASGAITPIQGYVAIPPLSTLPTTVAGAAAQVNNGGEVALFFAIQGLFSTSNAANVTTLDQLEPEEL